MFTWDHDAATGVYKNHALSNALMKAAALKYQFAAFTKAVGGYGKGKGESVTMPHYKPLDVPADGAKISELEDLPIDTLEMGTASITVYEFGRGVEVTYKSKILSAWDPEAAAKERLEDQMQYAMDVAAAAAFKTAKVCAIPTSLTAITWDTDGTPSTSATHNLTKAHVEAIRDYMAYNLHVPFYEGRHYAGILSTKSLRGIKSDRAFESWAQYLKDEDVLYNSEVGMIESIRMSECTLENCLSNSVGTGSVLGEGLFFGAEAVGRAEADYPHLRLDPNYKGDAGRRQVLAWYGLVGFGPYWDTANDREAKIVRLTSA